MNRICASVEMRNRRCVGESEEALLALLFTLAMDSHSDVYSQWNEDDISDEDYEQQINVATF